MSHRSWPRRLSVVGVVGALLILLIAGSAAVGLDRIAGSDHRLAQLSRAQRQHQDADMMHDALRADVARAHQAVDADPNVTAIQVRDETRAHAGRLREDIDALRKLDLPEGVTAALERLHPQQGAFVADSEALVEAILSDSPDRLQAQREFQGAFQALATANSEVTERLAKASTQAELTGLEETREVRWILGISTTAALAGWLILLFLLRRSGANLTEALGREAEQRAAAELLQRSLLPDRLPDVPGLRFAARYVPGTTGLRVGGDWYDVIELPSGRIGLVIGDVVGHDLQAATAMGQLRAALRAYAVDEPSPAAVLARLNRAAGLLDLTDMTTCLYAVFDPTSHELRWSSAGHLNPLSVCSAGEGRVLTGEPGPPLGATPTAAYQDRRFRLPDGCTVLLYTDGLVERRGTEIDEGLARLESVRGPFADPDVLCDDVLASLLAETPPAGDDVTLLALKP